jgi:hypothetical protein
MDEDDPANSISSEKDGCILEKIGSGECKICENGFFLSPLNICVKCVKGCLICRNLKFCLRCHNDYSLELQKGTGELICLEKVFIFKFILIYLDGRREEDHM